MSADQQPINGPSLPYENEDFFLNKDSTLEYSTRRQNSPRTRVNQDRPDRKDKRDESNPRLYEKGLDPDMIPRNFHDYRKPLIVN